ncbi:MAG: hypothetical protein E6771_14930 [Fusobacterium sp.]|nr:hypothetical protein [Fusobacterium sp.]
MIKLKKENTILRLLNYSREIKYCNKNILMINSIPDNITEEEEDILFDKNFVDIKDLKIKEIHKIAQKKLILALKEFYILNNGPVFCNLFNFDKLNDLGIYENDNQYTLEEKNQLYNLLCRLSGRELFYHRLFKLNNLEEFEILIKYNLVTFRSIKFYFRNLHLIALGKYDYSYILSGSYSNPKVLNILKNNDISIYKTTAF